MYEGCEDCDKDNDTGIRYEGCVSENYENTFDRLWKEDKLVVATKISDLTNEDFRQFMCDVCTVSYCTSKEDLLQLISEKL